MVLHCKSSGDYMHIKVFHFTLLLLSLLILLILFNFSVSYPMVVLLIAVLCSFCSGYSFFMWRQHKDQLAILIVTFTASCTLIIGIILYFFLPTGTVIDPLFILIGIITWAMVGIVSFGYLLYESIQ